MQIQTDALFLSGLNELSILGDLAVSFNKATLGRLTQANSEIQPLLTW